MLSTKMSSKSSSKSETIFAQQPDKELK